MTRKRKPGDTVFSVANYIFFGILTILCFYPFYYLIINSISANDISAAGEVLLLPKKYF